MRVLVIPTWYPSGEDKLMGIYHKEFTQALNKYGIDADMLYVEKERLSKPFEYLVMKKKEIIKEDNYKVFIYRMLNVEPLNKDWQTKRNIQKIEKSFKDYLKTHEKPDVIHAMCTYPVGYATCLIGKKYNIPVVVTEHGGGIDRFFKRADLKEYGDYVFKNSIFTTVSTYMQDIVKKHNYECFVLPNQVDTEIYKNNIKRVINGKFRIVMVCAIRQAKRLDMAFKAIHKLINNGIDVHLDIIGDGFYEKVYKDECVTEGISDYVSFLGRKNKQEIAEIFLNEHVLLISSELESFAIPGIEALASHLPVVSTDCGGPRDFITDKTGVLVKVNDPDSISDGLMKVYSNYSKYKKDDLEIMAQKFSDEAVVKKATELYNIAVKN